MTDPAIESLKQRVYSANMALVAANLVVLTWGNASGVDRERAVMAIKPSGVPYARLTPANMVLVSLESGKPLDGESLRPSSDTPTHLCLYQSFAEIGGIAHTHSRYATSWAQALREIPCYGTTHADTFHGPIPLVAALTPEEIDSDYEWNTGLAIVRHFAANGLSPLHTPGALLANHAPFAWGIDVEAAVEHAIIMEEVAARALRTEQISESACPAPNALQEKHFQRKHGAAAYYGQPNLR